MESCWWQGLLDTALCDKASSTNKTDHHYINEIVLKVALSTITITFLTLRLLVAPLSCSSFVLTIHIRYFYFILTIQYFVVYRATRNPFLLHSWHPSCYYFMTQVLCTIVWHMYYVLYYDTGILYYIMTQVFCTILWHRYCVHYDTGILDYIMTPVFCNILWDMYFHTILWHRYFVLYYDTGIFTITQV